MDISYVDSDKKQLICQYQRYQKNENKSEWYRCVIRTCGEPFNPVTMEKNDIEHYHKRLTDCEIDSFLYFKECCEVVKNNRDISLRDAYNRQYERLIANYHRKKSKPANPKETKDIQINEIYANINNQQFKNWLHGKYGFTRNHFANDGPRTNNHLEGYHAKFSKITSATSKNVLEFINMIKKSETETCNRFYNTERNPIEEPKQLPKNKRKDDILFDALQLNTSQHLMKYEQVDIEPIDQPKRAKLDEIGDIQFFEVRFWNQYERIPISIELLQLNHSQWLNNFYIF
ncbi:hypothetical protein BpHYR1_037506 [Brachionus plicatilis]|uniref:Uncharacterized protein n=1 Tax=Brachionus plicatilis TaxID=10195 RepID=A0A3M7SEU3_BRAPC|nr:hypothetical protein BpHYR1_037506 [Brachionus plicatilis]